MGNIVRAISNTNWSAAGTWQVWNGSSWQAYNQIPQVGDTVYLNARHPTVNVNISIGNGTITNEGNSDLGVTAHGYMVLTTGRTIVANLIAKDEYIFYRSVSSYVGLSLTGNISLDNASLFYTTSSNSIDIWHNGSSFITNNALYIYQSTSSTSNTNYTFTTNANVTLNMLDFTNVASAGSGIFTVNGNVEIISDFTQSNFVHLKINGILKTNSYFYTGTRIDFLGGYVISDLASNPLLVSTITLSNPSSFKIETLQLTDYPPESDVKKDVPYAFGELVGQYLPNFPPEPVVLKDYVYDNGNMTGMLEFPQVPTTSDIVTAIKNDSDLGGKINTTNTNVGNISTAVTTIDGKVDIIDTNVDTLVSRLTSVLTQRLGQSVTVEILQQILTAHLNN